VVPLLDTEFPDARANVERMHFRAVLAVPLMREHSAYGAMFLYRREPGLFSPDQVALVQTFARQAAIAIDNVRLFKETREALDQQTAISEILRAISASPTDVQPVLDAIAERAARLCDASAASIYLTDGDRLRHVASQGSLPDPSANVETVPIDRTSMSGCALLEGRTIHVRDMQAEGTGYPLSREFSQRFGHRSMVVTPLYREGQPFGTILLRRQEVRPFTDREVALLRTFGDQAAIAIENVRLFNETKEALDQQRASGEVLAAISSSIADTTPVFEKILESCERLFEGKLVGINLVGDDGMIRLGAYHGPGREGLEKIFPAPIDETTGSGLAILRRGAVHLPDVLAGDAPPGARTGALATGIKALVFAPMIWEGKSIGAIFVGRDYVGPFSDKDIALLRTFADQAVIAIQNARLFREIQDKSRQLEIANQHKSDFLANMSHELRTPLNAIIGFSEVLLERLFGELNDKQDDYLKDIHSSGRHLLSLINDILDLSKVEAGRMELDLSTFDAAAAISNAMTLVRERAQRHGITLGIDADPGLGEITADERKLKQILLNLLSNAVKFTPDGGRVDVSARRDDDNVVIAVHDTGIGIAAADQQTVFEEFRQVGTDYTTKQEGTGLGLALTRKFVELHGGRIRVDSEPGKGSTFTFTIPVTR
jgi:signal transduction histidine kinase/putative methionine-R-sulfoxide reductase with GAF domain